MTPLKPPPKRTRRLLSILLCSAPLCAQARPDAKVDFAREILPLLSDKCFVCHGPDGEVKDVLRLDSYAAATKDLGGRRAIDPENLAASELLARIDDHDDPMPPAKSGKKLTGAERALLRRWIAEGGRYARHWAFVPPHEPRPPAAGHPIDAFVGARLGASGVDFAPEADRRTLARRAALVLTGLLPRRDRLRRFLADGRPGAYERYVTGLLASPAFGEHQARYWLDAVRYGDTHGLHLDNRRGIFPYRDWVVRAFNDNLPLDEFLTWQLAGDLLPEPTLSQLVATGYVRMNPSTAEGGVIPAEFQAKNNFDRTETLGTVMLGMTMTCARCHSHKYDPISQREYFELLGFFNSTAESPLDGNRYEYAPVVRAPATQAAWTEWDVISREASGVVAAAEKALGREVARAHARAAARLRATDWRIGKAFPRGGEPSGAPARNKRLPGVLRRLRVKQSEAIVVSFQVAAAVDQTVRIRHSGGPGSTVRVGSGPARELARSLQLTRGEHVVRLVLTGAKRQRPVEVRIENPWRDWDASTAAQRLHMIADRAGPFARLPAHGRAVALAARVAAAERAFTTTLVARELAKPRATRLLRRGEYDQPTGDPLRPDVPDVMGAFPKDAPRNRLGLARWLTSRGHPLVARVLVNRIWQRTFGAGLVRTPEDFGLQGEQPTHPALLDWLAVELLDRSWNLKDMLRLMVTSRTFRQDSKRRAGIDDPENRLLARGPGHRLDAEVIRDIAVQASGALDAAMGGEGVKPYQPAGLWAALMHPASNTKRYVADKGTKLYRRSLYLYWKRTCPHPMMTLFDAPSREASCVRRSRSNTPLQSLALFNETQRLELARMIAQRLLREAADDAARLDLLFELLTSRAPTARERGACEQLLGALRSRYGAAQREAQSLLDLPGQTPRDRQLDPVAHAAWSQLVITVLASDAVISLY